MYNHLNRVCRCNTLSQEYNRNRSRPCHWITTVGTLSPHKLTTLPLNTLKPTTYKTDTPSSHRNKGHRCSNITQAKTNTTTTSNSCSTTSNSK